MNLLKQAQSHLARGIGRLSDDILVNRALGSYVYTSDGKKYLDFTTGIGVANLGHSHPHVVAAAQKQCAELIHAQVNIAVHEPMAMLIQKMLKVMPPTIDTFFFWNSGAEAVEASVKLARNATRRQNIVVFKGGYHGRTVGTMSLTTSDTIYRGSFGPLMPGVFVAPFPYLQHSPFDREDDLSEWCLREFELLLRQQTNPTETACAIIEPVQGEGGYVVPPKGFLKKLRIICQQHGILLVADEVQCGYGRTGTMFACDQLDVTPDILIMAKGIANGFPLSAIASRKELMDTQQPGSMGGTYAGNAVSCAAAIAVLEVFEKENILENCIKRGEELRKFLSELKKRYPEDILNVRGLGLMNGIEFNRPVAKKISKECFKRNLLLLKCSTYETLRFIPALNITQKELKEGLDIFEEAVHAVLRP